MIAVFRHEDLFRSRWVTDSRHTPGIIAWGKVCKTRPRFVQLTVESNALSKEVGGTWKRRRNKLKKFMIYTNESTLEENQCKIQILLLSSILKNIL